MNSKLFFSLVLCFCILFAGCGNQVKERKETSSDIDNIFSYAIQYEDGTFSPRGLEFGMELSAVLEELELSEESVDETQGAENRRILCDISVEYLGGEGKIIYNFYMDKLVSVTYLIGLESEMEESMVQTLKTQAEVLPADLMRAEFDMFTTIWEDAQGNYIHFGVTTDGNTLNLNLSMNKENLSDMIQ